ncbi:Ger(x)C family spore germination protein [Bacillus cereus group sp. BceL062]|uniref:Ger(x)C family spore germination protein n=1 Tax=Bacillus cereus group sp. BceL062 TaxID=3445166 RepID=UPI003F227905
MMNLLKYLSLSFFLFCCSGCWDQHLMKDVALVTAVAYDRQPNGKIQTTFFLPRVPNTSTGISKPTVQIVSTLSNTPNEGKAKLDANISGLLDTAKNRVLLLSDSLTNKHIGALLDSFYLEPKGNLHTPIIVIKGSAKNFMKKIKVKDELFSDYIYRIIQSAETNGLIEKQDIQSILSKVSNPKQDFVLPYMEVDTKQAKANINGLAMFHHHQYTGNILKEEQAKLYTLVVNPDVKNMQFTKKIHMSSHQKKDDFVTLLIKKSDRQIDIRPIHQNIHAKVHMDWQIALLEKTFHTSMHSKKALEKKLSHLFTSELQQVLQKLQQENCDSLGIQRELMLKDPQRFKHTNWKQQYSKVKFSPTIHVHIQDQGIVHL